MKKQTKIILTLILIILILAITGILFINASLTGNTIKEQENTKNTDVHMYTKALCNESNYCQDNEITCKGNETISILPITGAVIQNSQDWQDPRTKEDREKLC